VPVRNARDEVIAALNVVAPTSESSRSHVTALLTAARGITRALAAE
jgi:DNA-binding IclR family transcriptional regulator